MRDVPVLPAVAMLLAVLVVATAAAGMSGPDASGEGAASDEGLGVGSGTGAGAGQSDGLGIEREDVESTSPVPTSFVRLLSTAFAVLVVGGLVLAFLFTLWRDGLEGVVSLLKSVLGSAVGVTVFLAVLLVILRVLQRFVGSGGGGALGGGSVAESLTGGSGSGASTSPVDPSVMVFAMLGVVLVAAVALLSSRSLPSPAEFLGSDDESASARQTASGVEHEFDGPFEDVRPTNPVYRAWLDLVDAVDGESTRTPTEIAREATAAGYDPEAVRTVTEQFAEVRYGGQRVDDEREATVRSARDRLGREGEGNA